MIAALISSILAVLSLWLAGRVRIADAVPVAAEEMSFPAAAEAEVDAGEPILGCANSVEGAR
jgi:hypothetical protein